MIIEGRAGRYNPSKRTWKEYFVMMFNPLGLGCFNWVLYAVFVCGILGVFVLHFHKEEIEQMRKGRKADGQRHFTGMAPVPAGEGPGGTAHATPGSDIDGMPDHIKDFMKETGGAHTYSKQYEVSAEQAQKMMDDAMAKGAASGRVDVSREVEDVTEDEL